MQIYVNQDIKGHWESRPLYAFITKLKLSLLSGSEFGQLSSFSSNKGY